MRLLIANRGEIAIRIARTARRMGMEVVTAYSAADRGALHVTAGDEAVMLGGDDAVHAYLRADLVIDAARRSGADAVHPGYGFLSENADFAQRVADAGLVWVGPGAAAIEAMGSKSDARAYALRAGIPVLPGDVVGERFAVADADAVGFPLMVKASRGGGGMGLRVVREPDSLMSALLEARQQAHRAFGDGSLILERYLERPRHVEVQIAADRPGSVYALGDRDCSLQRRHQKLVEETPAPGLNADIRAALWSAAVDLARHIGYDSVGTAEFLLDDTTGEFFFLEMNTRLQVEHTVTEEVTGLDLVELQIRAALGECIDSLVADVRPSGCAIQARVTAEDAWAGYLPSSGRIERYRPPPDVRVDSGIEEGSLVTSAYDPLLLKVIARGGTREEARTRLDEALRELDIRGVATPLDHLVSAISSPDYRTGRISTALLGEAAAQPVVSPEMFAAAAAWVAADERLSRRQAVGPWSQLGEWRALGPAPSRTRLLAAPSGERHEVVIQEALQQSGTLAWRVVIAGEQLEYDIDLQRDGALRVSGPDGVRTYRCRGHDTEIVVHRPGVRTTLAVIPLALSSTDPHDSITDHDGNVRTPFPATVVELCASEGDRVTAGTAVVVVEAMKMLHSLTAPFDGVITEIAAKAGDTVASEQTLITLRREES